MFFFLFSLFCFNISIYKLWLLLFVGCVDTAILWWKPIPILTFHRIGEIKKHLSTTTNRVADGHICIWNATVTITAVIEMYLCVFECVCAALHRASARLFSHVSCVLGEWPFSSTFIALILPMYWEFCEVFVFCSSKKKLISYVTHICCWRYFKVLIYLRLVIYKS